jgi:outer membrane protein assembly factor BamD
MIKWAVTGWIFIVFVTGCASNPFNPYSEKEEKSADELMEEALRDYGNKYYEAAGRAFQQIIDRYPYSKYSLESELKLADCLYYQKEFDSAFDKYNEFQRLHPKNPDIPYVIFQKGMCHFEQTSTTDREQSHTLQAKDHFETLVKRYPDSEYAKQSHWKIRECYNLLAGAELNVANYYFKMKKYGAAMVRYRYILERYPDLGQYHEALEYLGKCQELLAQEQVIQEEIDEEKIGQEEPNIEENVNKEDPDKKEEVKKEEKKKRKKFFGIL